LNTQQALAKYSDVTFKYGKLDCCLFVLNVVRDLTGTDYAAQWRGKYNSELGALRIVQKYGSLAGTISHLLGAGMRPIWSVREGYPVLLSSQLTDHDSIGSAIGIYDGADLVYLTESGLARAPIMAGRGCWHV